MNSFSQTSAGAQVVLDSHAMVVNALEVANKAVIEAIRAVVAFDDAVAPHLMGCDMETLQKIAKMSPSKTLELLHTSVPIFSIRMAQPEFEGVLNSPGSGDAALQAVLRTFGSPLRLKTVG